jgi:hypothetical protein
MHSQAGAWERDKMGEFPSVPVGLLFCNSWRNLIDNYGKLNKAKFDVILRLEKEFGAQIYSAE